MGRVCIAVSSALPTFASAFALGDADVRSFVGQPLDVRIEVRAARNEWLDLECVQAKLGDRALMPLSSTHFRLQDSLETRTLIVRTPEAVLAPYLTLELRVECAGQSGGASRTYELSLPALTAPSISVHQTGEPARAAPAAPTGTEPGPASAGKAPSRQLAVGQWTASGRDSLGSIARGVYPRSSKMRAAFIARMRELNAGVTLPGDSDPLAAGLKLRLPDLVSLANESPRIDAALRDPVLTATERKVARKSTPIADSAAPVRPPAIVSKPPAAKIATLSPADQSSPKQAAESPQRVAPRPAQPTSGGFTLRLSGAEMDLSRSKGVSDATRAALRDKQLMLDADDQVAALLSLRNTVRQLEGRLNEIQLKLSTSTQPSVRPAPAPEAAPTPAPKAAPAAVATPPAVAPVPVEKAAPVAAPPQQIAEPTDKPSAAKEQVAPSPAAKPPAAAQPSEPQQVEEPSFWMSPLVLGSAAAALLILGGLGWLWARRNRGLPRTLAETNSTPAAHSAGGRTTSDLDGPSSDDLPSSEWDDDPPASTGGYRSSPPSAGLHSALREAEHQETVRMRAAPPDLLDAGAASLELDTRPATSVDFVLGDEGGEDKSRRQRYMEERFPELAHHSISVDEPDSIIDAARHHYEEGELQKAVELLTYAFEERPGQLRFWLALFEIHRLEQRVTDFAELAARFKNVHGGTDAWPKVQHIGRDLDPGQPLYSAALGRLGVPMDADFDPMSENWLNVPMDFTSDVLMIELRHSLMAEHVVLDDELRRTIIEVPA